MFREVHSLNKSRKASYSSRTVRLEREIRQLYAGRMDGRTDGRKRRTCMVYYTVAMQISVQ